jgi:ABC-type transporter Mla maintaining outer membrane lipid asymmetry ATPase subunit MlaF
MVVPAMTTSTGIALEIVGVRKEYGALRPLRMNALRVPAGSAVAVLGLDAQAAEMFVNLATGAALPDEGEVRVFGSATAAIAEPDAWLQSLDRFGILSDRAVLLDELTAAQNLAMTLTLDVDPMSDDVRERVGALAQDVGLTADLAGRRIGDLDAPARARVRLGRAVALDPSILLLEHPTASLPPDATSDYARDLRRVIAGRRLAAVLLTADAAFASAVTADVRRLVPATGDLAPAGGAWTRVRRLFGV